MSEIGTTLRYDPIEWLRVDADGYVQVDADSRPVTRSGVALRFEPDKSHRFVWILAGRRVETQHNGYFLLRQAARVRVSRPVALTHDLYGYFYDQRIAGYSTSLVLNENAQWQLSPTTQLLLGGSLQSTPYAKADVRGLVRAIVDLDQLGELL
jgi:hypothetical protein